MEKRIMLLGPSGVGKTTLAKIISHEFDIPFISGSISDLVPKTKELTHLNMMERSYTEIYNEDNLLFSLRRKNLKHEKEYVTDRSYLDIMAYHLIKISKGMQECDTAILLQNVALALFSDCTHLIFVPFTKQMIKTWEMEDNHKRVLNRYFQWHVSTTIYGLLNMFGYHKNMFKYIFDGLNTGRIYPEKIFRELELDSKLLDSYQYNTKYINVLILKEDNYDKRNDIIKKFLL